MSSLNNMSSRTVLPPTLSDTKSEGDVGDQPDYGDRTIGLRHIVRRTLPHLPAWPTIVAVPGGGDICGGRD